MGYGCSIVYAPAEQPAVKNRILRSASPCSSSATVQHRPNLEPRFALQILGDAGQSGFLRCSVTTEELLGHSVERVYFKLDVRRGAQKHQFHWLLRNRTFRGTYRASEKVASQRADFRKSSVLRCRGRFQNAANSMYFLAPNPQQRAVRHGMVAEGVVLETNLLQGKPT